MVSLAYLGTSQGGQTRPFGQTEFLRLQMSICDNPESIVLCKRHHHHAVNDLRPTPNRPSLDRNRMSPLTISILFSLVVSIVSIRCKGAWVSSILTPRTASFSLCPGLADWRPRAAPSRPSRRWRPSRPRQRGTSRRRRRTRCAGS